MKWIFSLLAVSLIGIGVWWLKPSNPSPTTLGPSSPAAPQEISQPPTADNSTDDSGDDIQVDCLIEDKKKVGSFSARMPINLGSERKVTRICWQLHDQRKCEHLNVSFVGGALVGPDGYALECDNRSATLRLGQSANYLVYTELGFKIDKQSQIIFKSPETIQEDESCMGSGCIHAEEP